MVRTTSGILASLTTCLLFGIGTIHTVAEAQSVPEILSLIYSSTNGASWSQSSGWVGGNPNSYCEYHWLGIHCYSVDATDARYGHIETIDLSENGLVGNLPSEIFALPYLSQIILRDNPDLNISFQGIEQATSLKSLILSRTRIESFDGIENASDTLEELHITGSGYEGTFPLQVTNLSNLKAFYANYNNIQGEIPVDIANMKGLNELYLYENGITGNFPLALSSLTELEVLVLSNNYITGEIPKEVNNLLKLRVLAMANNQFNGYLPAFDSLQNLSELYLQDNYLEGELPLDFLFAGPKHDPIIIDLRNNYFSGTFTGLRLKEYDFLSIYLSGNKFDAIDQSFCTMDNWMDGNVDIYGCDAIMCPVGYYSPSGRQTSDNDICRQCGSSTLGHKYMGATDCGNEQKAILKGIFDSMGGGNWVGNNWSEEADECLWTGISCDDNGDIVNIELSAMGLSGSPPIEIFSLPQLRVLDFSENFIKFRFDGIGQAENLKVLNLFSTGLDSLDDIEQLLSTSLTHLILSSNNVYGNIPDVIWDLWKLEELAISHNHFRGGLSENIGNLQNLVIFHAYGNSLGGEIPSTIGNLRDTLKELVLSENDFVGEIPNEISSMHVLETFSMHQTTNSQGGLSGSLPNFADCYVLSTLHLSGNSISGELPGDFLINSDYLDSRYIEIDLSSNYFEGQIPKSWQRFQFLNIDLSNNRITHVPGAICRMHDWQDGFLGESNYNCNYLLCDMYSYNAQGRATESSPCVQCDSADYFGATYCSNENTDNLAILESLYASTNGYGWKNSLGWFMTNDVCDGWYGIICDDDGIDIVAIDLSDNGLSGTPSTMIFNLPKLKELSLQDNQIDFSFDGIDTATKLEVLYLSRTRVSSLEGIDKAQSLKSLHLTECYLSGPIPSEIFNLVNLESLYMNYNEFSGRIPSTISQLTSLKKLFLTSNSLSGPIPAAIGDLSQLQILSLTDNTFSGRLPAEINKLENLVILAIEHERRNESKSTKSKAVQNGIGLTGELPSFDGLHNLQQILLGYNSLSGTIPYNFLVGITDKSRPLTIDLEYNMLVGDVPSSLTQFSDVQTSLHGNKFTGVAPGLCQMSKWNQGDVASYKCDAILCPKNTYSSTGRATDDEQCQSCPEFTASLYLGAVECMTDDEMHEQTERQILKNFYDSLQGSGWNTRDLWYDEGSSFCEWYGITCTADESDSVEEITLTANGLVGIVPQEIFDLPNLTKVNLSGNKVSINFDGIEKAIKLKSLILDNTGLQSLSGLENAPSIQILHVTSNSFISFPYEVLNLGNLEVLYMSHNKFNMDLPDLSGLTKLAYLQCNQCSFTGVLPDWIGNMQHLQYLSLAGNLFSGVIPASFSQLTLLEHLDLSEQSLRGGGLTGGLPSFSSLENLNILYLNRNFLSGEISPDFLLNTKQLSITVDLRYNELSGAVPDIFLNRFNYFTILLAENKITSIPTSCSQDSYDLQWNNGDVKEFGCDGIMCAPGSYSPLGRKTVGERFDCEPCTIANNNNNTDVESYYGSTTCGLIPDKLGLEAIYKSLGGPDWVKNDQWMENDMICEWHGVICDENGYRVIGLDLEANGLIGTIPDEIVYLSELRSINFKKNRVKGTFSSIGTFDNLLTLNLSENGISYVVGLSEVFSSLKVLHLTGNSLTAIPEDIYNLLSLEELYMNYNQMSGVISSKIGQLTELRELYMFRNKLGGNLPAELGLLTELRTLGLGENAFSGTLPPELNNLPNIRTIALQQSQRLSQIGTGGPLNLDKNRVLGLTGTLPPFDNSPKLTEIYLAYNDINGSISPDFLKNVRTDIDIIVDLTMNHISGAIPSQLQRFDYMTIFLGGNEIESFDDNLCNIGSWMGGEVEKTGCDAILCPPGTYNEYGRKINVGQYCKACPFTFSAPYYGSGECVPDVTNYSEKEILMKLYEATNGKGWLDSDNWNKNDVSICNWYGIHCMSEDFTGGEEVVKAISLPSNKLTGTIPPQVFSLPHLEVLNIRDNKVDIELAGLTEKSFGLLSLYIDNTLVSDLSGVGQLRNLQILHAQQNNFMGNPISEDVFTLIKLKELYISDSKIGGELSSNIGMLTELVEVFSHNNDMTGEIPSEIGQLSNLETLVLSENQFVGPLPDMSGMQSLQSLLIDSYTSRSAGLSGPLPSFEELPNLREIYLNENSFTGTISNNFLSSVNNKYEGIKVGLKGNRIEGELPRSLRNFSKLDIDLANNLITSIHSDLCDQSLWMAGYVEQYGCDAILCPVGYYNQFGRQDNSLVPCKKCSGNDQSPYLGATKCQAEVKSREREILEILYKSCGGSNWKNKENWMNDDVDICHWYGIQCNDEGSVDSVLLGSNNVNGKIPKELFELKSLKWLWLYSNPIDFSFHGIGEATSLTSLLLDSTGLKSLDGIGQAYQLVDLEVRFNRLSGPIPDELTHLVNLETLSMSENDFTGTVPSFNKLLRLKSLRISKNKLTGSLPSFASNYKLRTIDLSNNRISGEMSPNFLYSLSDKETVFVDLSHNRIGGEVPEDLKRFDKMTLYLNDNFITDIHEELCYQSYWNDGDVGLYQCDAILCPPGTYAPTRGRDSQSSQCKTCNKAKYYGQSQCVLLQNSATSRYLGWSIAVTLSITMAMLTIL